MSSDPSGVMVAAAVMNALPYSSTVLVSGVAVVELVDGQAVGGWSRPARVGVRRHGEARHRCGRWLEVALQVGEQRDRAGVLLAGGADHAHQRLLDLSIVIGAFPARGVLNRAALTASCEVVLCESLIDALSFWCYGQRHVTAAYGVEGFTAEHLAASTGTAWSGC